MPQKRQTDPIPSDARIMEFPPSEVRPLIVSSKDIEKVVIGYSSKTAANDRSRKRGPKFYMVGGTPYYKISELVEFFTQNPVETLND